MQCWLFMLYVFSGRENIFIDQQARKRIQVSGGIHFEHILFFRVSPGYLNLKIF